MPVAGFCSTAAHLLTFPTALHPHSYPPTLPPILPPSLLASALLIPFSLLLLPQGGHDCKLMVWNTLGSTVAPSLVLERGGVGKTRKIGKVAHMYVCTASNPVPTFSTSHLLSSYHSLHLSLSPFFFSDPPLHHLAVSLSVCLYVRMYDIDLSG